MIKTWDFIFKNKSAMWTAIFTGILSIYSYKLYQVSNAANETARESQRAFLNFSRIEPMINLYKPTDNRKRIGVDTNVLWNNSGTTPVEEAVTAANAQLWPGELPDSFDFKDLKDVQPVPLTVGPKGEGGASMLIGEHMLESQHSGTSRLYVWGWAIYKDVFKGDPDRLTEFCTEIVQVAVPSGKSLDDISAPIAWNLSQCKHHNCYDDNCSDYSERITSARKPN